MNAVDSSSWQHTNVDSRLVTLLRYTIDIDALHCTSNIGAVGYHCKQKVQVDWSEAALVGTCCAASQQMCDIARNRLLLVVAGDYRFLAISFSEGLAIPVSIVSAAHDWDKDNS